MKGNIPKKGSEQWKKNEKTINENGFLRQMRDRTEGIEKSSSYSNHGGKGSSSRPMEISKEEFASNWDRIFSKKGPADE